MEKDRVPDGLRASPTGRVPQWVLDEAAGLTVEPAPWRGPTSSGYGAPRRSRSRAGLRYVGVLAVAGTLGAAALYLVQLSGATTESQPTPVAAQSGNAPPPGYEEENAPLGTPPVLTGQEGQGFRFARHEDGTAVPVTWSPCRPIHYVTRLANAPLNGQAMLDGAFASVAAATGLTFVSDGQTAEAPSEDRSFHQPAVYGDRWAPVLVAWATRSEVPDFGVDIAGEAGAASVETPSGDSTYVSGVVYLDPVKLGQIAGLSGEPEAQMVIMHELGHLVGLAHVDDEEQIMFPRGGMGVVDFGAGDRAGLAALGRGPCQPDV